jgi:hypothetical protein
MADNEKLLELKAWVRREWEKRLAGQPSEWNQGTWIAVKSCGTVCCVAGKAALNAGWIPDPDATSWVHLPDDPHNSRPVEEVSDEVLGLTPQESFELYRGSNSVEDVERLIDLIVAGEFDPDTWENSADRQLSRLNY